jgi:hypothetical protein
MKSVRRIKFAQKPETIPYSKRGILFLEKDQEKTVYRGVAV